MNRTNRVAVALVLLFLFGAMSIPGCQKDDSAVMAQLQSLNNDMTTTKALLQQLTSALEMQKARIALLEQRQTAHPAPATKAKKAPANKSRTKRR